MKDSEPEYVNLRVPKAEYEKLKNAKKIMSTTSDYSWAKSLALGSLIGLVVGIAIGTISKK